MNTTDGKYHYGTKYHDVCCGNCAWEFHGWNAGPYPVGPGKRYCYFLGMDGPAVSHSSPCRAVTKSGKARFLETSMATDERTMKVAG